MTPISHYNKPKALGLHKPLLLLCDKKTDLISLENY